MTFTPRGVALAELPSLLRLLAAAGAGAALATALGLPAGALIGACAGVALAAGLGVRVALPVAVRDLAFTVIGVSLGAGVDAGGLSRLGEWAASLGMLAASLVAIMALCPLLLRRGFGLDRDTAVLSSAPGALSYVVAVSLESRADAGAVTVLQLIRLLSIVTAAPLFVSGLGLSAASAGAAEVMSATALAALCAGGYGLGLVGMRLGVPAATMLAGMILTVVVHASGLATGVAPSWTLFGALTLTGAAVGVRLRSVNPRRLAAMARAGLAMVAASTTLSLLFATATAFMTRLPLGEVWIAFAPGGVEAMAAIGLALGYDPAFIAIHHFVRLILLLGLVPLTLRLGGESRN